MPRGGRRPGAGAPRRNLNHPTHRAAAPPFHRAVLILAVAPEVRSLLRTLQRAEDSAEKRTLEAAMDLALKTVADDPTLAQTIKNLVLERIERAQPQLHEALEVFENDQQS